MTGDLIQKVRDDLRAEIRRLRAELARHELALRELNAAVPPRRGRPPRGAREAPPSPRKVGHAARDLDRRRGHFYERRPA